LTLKILLNYAKLHQWYWYLWTSMDWRYSGQY